MRLDKFLSHTGFGSRKEVKELLKKGYVTVNGEIIKQAKIAILEDKDIVCVNGQPVVYQQFFYYMLNKPTGVISATSDTQQKTVLDLLKKEDYHEDLFPVGRLDKDTVGLLLLTNDGNLAHRLLSPKNHVLKTYFARVEGIVTDADQKLFTEGIVLKNGEKCQSAELLLLKIDETKQQTEIQVKIMEGKYHQVKRMIAAVGKKVIYLQRISMGSLQLDTNLELGEYRPLTENELSTLLMEEK